MMDEQQGNEYQRPVNVQGEKIIPVMQEHINLSREVIETGSVRIQKEIEEKDVVIDASLSADEIEVKRVELNTPVQVAPPAVRYEGNTMIISVLQEEIVVHRRLILREELHVTKTKVSKEVKHPVTLRKEVVSVKQDLNNENLKDKQ